MWGEGVFFIEGVRETSLKRDTSRESRIMMRSGEQPFEDLQTEGAASAKVLGHKQTWHIVVDHSEGKGVRQ